MTPLSRRGTQESVVVGSLRKKIGEQANRTR
jgi:hypothetical protein